MKTRDAGALGLRDAARDDELLPCDASICAHRAALRSAALIDRQPDGAIWSHMDMAVQTVTLRDPVALVGQDTWAVASAESIAALAGGGAQRE